MPGQPSRPRAPTRAQWVQLSFLIKSDGSSITAGPNRVAAPMIRHGWIAWDKETGRYTIAADGRAMQARGQRCYARHLT